MGNIFYFLLTARWPFEKVGEKEGIKKVKHGSRPPIPDKLHNSTDPAIQVLLKGIQQCWVQDPKERATARQIQTLFGRALTKMGVQGE